MAKKLHELSETEFNKLKETGLLQTIYPDCKVEKFEDLTPQVLQEIDWSGVISLAKDHLQDVIKGEERDDDDHYMYEEVMKAVYGKNIFDFINKFDR